MTNFADCCKRSLGQAGRWVMSVIVATMVVACSGSAGRIGSGTGGVDASGGATGGELASGGVLPAGGGASGGGATVSQGSGGATGTEASTTTGGSTANAGTAGGAVATGGIAATGGTDAAGGSQASSGASSAGGVVVSGGTREPGGATSTGTFSTGGATRTAGATAAASGTSAAGATGTGGTQASGGTTGGSKITGGTATGGVSASGGTAASGGVQTTGSSAGGAVSDRCDVGIYNPASPPQVLALSGNLATHDPSAIESNGTTYEFQTGLGAKTSANLTSWNAAATPFGTPAWMTTAVPGVQGLWAPDISFFGGQYHLYYAGSYPFGANISCIGHATRTTMNAGSWTDQGSAIICSTSANNWNAIDPNLIVDTAGVPWLVFGSWWSGIQIIQLNSQGSASANSTVSLIAGRGGKGIEGAFMVRRCGYYYLFTSWDACCQGFKSTYNIRVGRSTGVDKGFADKDGVVLTAGGGTLVAAGNGTTFNGPGGQSVMIVGTKAYLVYHAYAPDSVVGGSATLRIADLVWDSSGWPVPVGP